MKTVTETRDAEARKYAIKIIPIGDYEFEGTFRWYVEEYPADERKMIADNFKAGFDCRDKMDNEALKVALEKIKVLERKINEK